MGKNIVREEFLYNGSWTCPAGVKKVDVRVFAYLLNTQVLNVEIGGSITPQGQVYLSGFATYLSSSTPSLLTAGFQWQQISGYNANFFGISVAGDGYAAGSNTNGALGDGTVTARSSPTLIVGGLKWRQIAGSSSGGVGISSAGDAYAWGVAGAGALGDGTVAAKSSPVLVLGGKKWLSVARAGLTCLGIDSSQDLYAWGANNNGQLGDGTVVAKSSPVLVLGGKKWAQVAIGNNGSTSAAQVYGITTDGDLYAWGINRNGQLGLGDVTPRSSPVLVVGGLKWRFISAGENNAVGVISTGDAYSMGLNNKGQLGDGTTTPRSSPVLVVGGLKWARVIAAGYGLGAAGMGGGITVAGDRYAWGFNDAYQAGNGVNTPTSSPVLALGGYKYQTVYQTQAAAVTLDVTPGTTYALTLFAGTVLFDNVGVFQDTAGAGALPTKVILEYEG